MNKSRVLFIMPLPPPVHGSAMMSQYIKESKGINERFRCDYVNLSTSRSMSEIGKKSPIKIFRFFNAYLKTFFKLCTKRYDLCYLAITCHGRGFLKDTPFALLCKLFGNRIVIHQHNKGLSKDVDKPLYKFLFKAVYKNAKVILLSNRLFPDISGIVNNSQVMICPNGVPQTKQYPKENNVVPRLLFLSNLIESKGVLVLLDACKILKEKGYNFNCDFIGGETKEIDSKRFEKEVTLRNLNEEVHYIGPKYNEHKHIALANSDLLIFPTYYENETFGLVLLEGMQQSTPQISTAVGGIPDVIEDGETGFIVKERCPEDLASKIEILLKDPDLREKMGQKSVERFNNNFTQSKFEENIATILTNIIEENK